MNPYATEDFQNAVKNASEKLKEMAEKMKCGTLIREDDFPYISFDDLKPEYSGVMRLQYSPIGAWQDVFNILVASGYKVIAEVEDATETETELDGVEKWVVIEYGEVE